MERDFETHWLKQWRKSAGLTQKQAAALLGLKHRMVQNYEAGTHDIPRYVRLSCFAITEGIVDFGEQGARFSHNLSNSADELRHSA